MRYLLPYFIVTAICMAFTVWFASLRPAGARTDEEKEDVAGSVGPTAAAYARVRNSIVTIRAERQNKHGRVTPINATGVIVHSGGLVVTSSHVIEGAQNLLVTDAIGKELSARVLESSPQHDLAILQVSGAEVLSPVAFADPQTLVVGQPVLAVGNPYGYANTASAGIISALNRRIKMPDGHFLEKMVQTDASINPGNSGGPLFNTAGELIGINAAMREEAHGISFAVHVDYVKRLVHKHAR
jgi:serine protease Do